MLKLAGRGVLLATLLAACLAVRAEDDVQTTFDRLAKMNFAEQQAWLERLERRAASAARLTLEPDEAAAQQARTHAALHQNMVSWKSLGDVVKDTNAREKKAIAVLAFQYDDRGGNHDAWTAVHRDWKKAGSRFDDQDRLVDWLETAMKGLAPKADQAEAKPEVAKPQAVKKETAKPQAVKHVVAKPEVTDQEESVAPNDQSPDNTVEVNVGELDARIAGSNLALREFEAGLDEKGEWNAARLEPLVERLRILTVRRNDLGLVRDLVPKENRDAIAPLESPKSAISQLSVRVVEARENAGGPKFSGDDAKRRAEMSRLEKISRRMAELSGK